MIGLNKRAALVVAVLAVFVAGGVCLAQDWGRGRGERRPGMRRGEDGERMGRMGMRRGMGHHRGEMRGMGRMERRGGFRSPMLGMARELKLTDKQIEAIKAVFAGARDKMRAQREKTREARRALMDATRSGDEANIRAAAAKVGKLMGDAAVALASVRAEARKALTPEQVKHLDELCAERRTQMDKRRRAQDAWRKIMQEPKAAVK